MNKTIMRACGFGKQVDLMEAGLCTGGCGTKTIDFEFRDERSEKEALISGLCQKCQDKHFQEPK